MEIWPVYDVTFLTRPKYWLVQEKVLSREAETVFKLHFFRQIIVYQFGAFLQKLFFISWKYLQESLSRQQKTEADFCKKNVLNIRYRLIINAYLHQKL